VRTWATEDLGSLFARMPLSDGMIAKLLSGAFENERVLLTLIENCQDESQLERIVRASLTNSDHDRKRYTLIHRGLFRKMRWLFDIEVFERIRIIFWKGDRAIWTLPLANSEDFEAHPFITL
jgi:hypothetical protein